MMIKKGTKLYLFVSADKYEFPIYITDTIDEMSEKTGRPKGSIYSELSRQRHGIKQSKRFREVDL